MGMEAVNCVALTNEVATLFRLKLTIDPDTKPLPFTVSVNCGPPAVALVGEMLETTGWVRGLGGKIVSVSVLEIPPPVTPFEGFVTEILSVPGLAISATEKTVSSNVGLRYFVVMPVLLTFMTELVTKLEPITARAKEIPPAVMLDGFIDEMAGSGVDTGNSTEVDAPPPGSGLKTKTRAVPPLLISVPRIVAFSCAEFTNVVVRACPSK